MIYTLVELSLEEKFRKIVEDGSLRSQSEIVRREWRKKIEGCGGLIRAESFCGWGVCHCKLDTNEDPK